MISFLKEAEWDNKLRGGKSSERSGHLRRVSVVEAATEVWCRPGAQGGNGVDMKAPRSMWGWQQGNSRKGKIAKQRCAGPRQASWTEKPVDGQAESMGFLGACMQ